MEIEIHDGETVTQNRDEWKQACVAVIGLNGFRKTKDERI